jgi:hypothetical protein
MSVQQKARYTNDQFQPFHEYMDNDFNVQNDTEKEVQLQFSTTRTVPYLDSPEKYFLSIVRFNIDTNIPVFIPKLNYANTIPLPDPNLPPYVFDPNLTDYFIGFFDVQAQTMRYKWVEFQTDNATIPTPTSYNQESPYYYIYSFMSFIAKINDALQDLTSASGISTTDIPYLTLNMATLNITLNIPNIIVFRNSFDIYINQSLKNLLFGMPFIYTNYALNHYTTLPSNQQIPPKSNNLFMLNMNATDQETTGTTKYGFTTQQTPMVNWTPIKSIVFTSNTLPIIQSSETDAKPFGSNNLPTETSSSNATGSILTDFVISIGPNSLYSPSVLYVPSGEYRLIDMYSNQPLTKFDFQVWWKDRYNNLRPLYIPSGGSASIKVMFRKKNFNTSSKNIIV